MFTHKNDILLTPIEYLKGVGPQRGELLRKELGIHTFGDMLTHYPFRYMDRSSFIKIKYFRTIYIYIPQMAKLRPSKEFSLPLCLSFIYYVAIQVKVNIKTLII